MMFDLREKVAVVTGASRGIGRAVAQALAAQGAHVVLNFKGNEAAALETLKAIEAQAVKHDGRGSGELCAFDVADPQAVENAFADLAKRLPRLDILVNNAGISIDQLLLRLQPADFERTWNTNVSGALWCAKAAIRTMMRAKRGRIIQLSSVVAESGNPGQAAYSASKAALIGLTKTLAREYASRGITVNAVAPGYIETDMTSELSDAARQATLAQIPLGHIGRPEDIAAAVVYLSSDEAAYVTGQVLRVNGGMYV